MCVSLNHSWGLVSQTGIQVKTVDQKHLVVVMTTHSKIIPKQQRQNKSRLWQKEQHHTSHMKTMTAPLNNRQWIGFKGTSSPETHGFLPSNIGVCLGVPVSIFPSSNSVKMTAESFNFSSAIKISLASWRPWRWFFLLSKRDSQFSWIILVSYISLIKNWLVIYI